MITLYTFLALCLGQCDAVHGWTAQLAHQSDLLLYTSLADCQAAAKEEALFGGSGLRPAWHTENYCTRIFFADYAQTERLLYGRVTCSYRTTMPESVMARLLDPYYTQTGKNACKAPKGTR